MNAAYDGSFYQGLPCLAKHNASVASCGAWSESVLFKSTCTAQLLFLIAYCGAQWLSWYGVRLGIEGLLVRDSHQQSHCVTCVVSSSKTFYPLLSTGLTQEERKSSQHE